MVAFEVHDNGSKLTITADGRDLTGVQINDLLQRLTGVATILSGRWSRPGRSVSG